MELLKELTETPGVPGREERVRDLLVERTKGLFDEHRVDPMGNLICRRKAGRKPRGDKALQRVMLACHIDEIGFYVKFIDKQGHLRIQHVGGFDTRNLFARRVLVQGKKDLIGVLNPTGRPIHLASDEEKKKTYKVGEFFVDLFRPAAEVRRLVHIGDPVTLVQPLDVVGKVATGKALDNRVASWVAINALRKVGRRSPYDIYFVATVQEEVGCRGAGPGAFGIEPDVGIALDTTLACDTPGISDHEAVTRLGGGVGIKVLDGGSISHHGLFTEFVDLAESKKIKHQREILPLGGTDAATVQRASIGRKTITLSVPTRYIHTVTEAVHQDDLKAAVNLLAAWLTTA
ncbi:MAG: M42 family metallopeptidase [bacterium]|nr:M42 family metallopeptidase [bacterium]